MVEVVAPCSRSSAEEVVVVVAVASAVSKIRVPFGLRWRVFD